MTDGDVGPGGASSASSTASVLRSSPSGRIARNQSEEIGAFAVARLAVDQRHLGPVFTWRSSSIARHGIRGNCVGGDRPRSPQERRCSLVVQDSGFAESPIDLLIVMWPSKTWPNERGGIHRPPHDRVAGSTANRRMALANDQEVPENPSIIPAALKGPKKPCSRRP